jgi:hypothetical protein
VNAVEFAARDCHHLCTCPIQREFTPSSDMRRHRSERRNRSAGAGSCLPPYPGYGAPEQRINAHIFHSKVMLTSKVDHYYSRPSTLTPHHSDQARRYWQTIIGRPAGGIRGRDSSLHSVAIVRRQRTAAAAICAVDDRAATSTRPTITGVCSNMPLQPASGV